MGTSIAWTICWYARPVGIAGVQRIEQWLRVERREVLERPCHGLPAIAVRQIHRESLRLPDHFDVLPDEVEHFE